MTSEAQVPDALLAHAGFSGTPLVTDIDDDPDGPDDGNWLVASGNNINTNARVSFPTPSDGLTGGADLQEFRAKLRQFDGGQSGTPTARLELWRSGSLIRAGSDTDITSTTGQVLSFTWDANEVLTADDVECKIVGTKTGGSPTTRNTVDVGAVEWVAEITIGDTIVAVADASEAHAADGATFTQVHDLAIADGDHSHSTGTASFAQVHNLAIADGSHGHSAEAASFTQVHDLAIIDASHGHGAEGTSFAQVHDLTIADADHGQSLDAASFAQIHDLTIDAAIHDNGAQGTSFAQVHDLGVADGNHSHSADNATFDQIFNLALDDAAHANSAEVVQFSQVHDFLIEGAVHGQGLEATSFAQLHDYLVDDLAHAETLTTSVLEQIHELIPSDAVSAQAATAPGFSQLHLLAVADAMHAMDNPGIVMVPQVIPGPPTAFLKAALAAPVSKASEGGAHLRGSLR